MWNRKELKEQGRAAVKRNYWKSVLVSAIFMGVIGVAGFGQNSAQDSAQIDFCNAWVIASMVLVALLALVVVILTYELLVNPFEVGVNRFRLNALNDKGNVSDMGTGFDISYKRNVKVLFFRDLYTVLWLMLFIVPGIVKMYEYRMIPYILADDPDICKSDAFKMSKQMMKGNKWRAFILDLSFILWGFLSLITMGIVGVFWAAPYKQLTDAALYNALKTE